MLPEGSRTHNRPKALHRSPSLSRGRPSDISRFGGRRGGETGGQGLAETHRKHEPIPDVSQAFRRFWSRPGAFWTARVPHTLSTGLGPVLRQRCRNVTQRSLFDSVVGVLSTVGWTRSGSGSGGARGVRRTAAVPGGDDRRSAGAVVRGGDQLT